MRKAQLLILLSILLLGCESAEPRKKTTVNKIIDAKKVLLNEEIAQIQLPKSYIKSSRYTIGTDLKDMQEDTISLRMQERMLRAMEFEDSDIDVFVDTLSQFNRIIIVDIPLIELNPTIGGQLNSVIKNSINNLCYESEGNLSAEKIESTMKQVHSDLQYFKFKYRILNHTTELGFDFTYYIFSSSLRTYLIYEYTITEDIERYLRKLKDN